MDADYALATLKAQLDELGKIERESLASLDANRGFERLRRWKARTVQAIRGAVSSQEATSFESEELGSFMMGNPLGNFKRETDLYRAFLLTLEEEIRNHPTAHQDSRSTKKLESPAVEATPSQPSPRTTVFVVHGHNEALKLEVAQFIEKIHGRRPVVLHEQSDKGKTIIEKFEKHSAEAAFAVVLLTGDDEGRQKGTNDLLPRARQNVVFELGAFFGSIGRDRVAILYAEGVDRPSDIDGLLYTKMGMGDDWKLKLAREMKASGLQIDMNKAL